jgi:hypothetical protein
MIILAVPLQAACSAPVLSGMVAQVCLGKVGAVAARGSRGSPATAGTGSNRDVPRGGYRAGRSGDDALFGLFRAHPRDRVPARGTGLALVFVHARAAGCQARR